MTVSKLNTTSTYIGLSTDTKPRPEVGSTFFETDTQATYIVDTVGVWTLAVTPQNYGTELALGNIGKHDIIHKFGATMGVSSSTVYSPVAFGEVYQMPQVSGATTLRVAAGNANDTAGGSGARLIMLQGLDETGAPILEEVPTAGESAGAASTTTFIRLNRAWVTESGTYASAGAGSHEAPIVIENGAGGTTWGTIQNGTSYPHGQSQIAALSVPLGVKILIPSFNLTVDGVKKADFILAFRENILETAAPFTAMRVIEELVGVTGSYNENASVPFGPFPALTDVIWMARGDVTPTVTVDFEIELILD